MLKPGGSDAVPGGCLDDRSCFLLLAHAVQRSQQKIGKAYRGYRLKRSAKVGGLVRAMQADWGAPNGSIGAIDATRHRDTRAACEEERT